MSYLFYRIYRASLIIRKGADPEIRTWIFFSIIQGINLYSIEQFYFSITSQKGNIIPDYVVVLIGLSICVLNYFLYIHKDRFLRISEKYSKESKSERIRGAIIGYIYVFGSIALVFYAKHLQFS